MKRENLEKKTIKGKEKKSYEKPRVTYSGTVEVVAGCGVTGAGDATCGKTIGCGVTAT